MSRQRTSRAAAGSGSSTAFGGGDAIHDVVCVGNLTRDWLLHVEALPALDDVAFVEKSIRCIGGRGAIPAMVASALGSRTALCTVVGARTPRDVLKPLEDCNVDLAGICRGGDTDEFFEVVVAIGRREQNSVSYFLPKEVPFEVTEIHRSIVATGHVVYFSTHRWSFNYDLLRNVAYQGTVIVHNLSPYLFRREEYRDLMLARSSVLVGNESEVSEFLTALGADSEELFRRHPKLSALVVTAGSSGVRVYGGHGSCRVVPAIETEVITPLGAGDAFAGGFLHALAQGREPEVAAETGVLAAAESLRSLKSYPDPTALRRRVLDAGTEFSA